MFHFVTNLKNGSRHALTERRVNEGVARLDEGVGVGERTGTKVNHPRGSKTK